MVVVVGGSVTEVNDRQPKKTRSPILITVFGILIDLREVQQQNALSSMYVTVVSTSTVV